MIKTISLTANQEAEIELTGGCHVSVENRGTGIIYASKSAGVTAGADGVIAIDSGVSKKMKNTAAYSEKNGIYDYHGKIYLLSDTDGTAEIETGNYFFDSENSGKGGNASSSSSSPYIYMTQAEYESLTEYEQDKMYWVTYPLSGCYLVWKNGECIDGIGSDILAGESVRDYGSSSTYYTVLTCYRKYLAIAYNTKSCAYSVTNSVYRSIYPYLRKIDIAKGVTSIGDYTFYECRALSSVSIPDSVTTIRSYAFRYCTGLKEITIPDSVTTIGNYAFRDCTNLATIAINKPQDSISGAPWSAPNATVVWTG